MDSSVCRLDHGPFSGPTLASPAWFPWIPRRLLEIRLPNFGEGNVPGEDWCPRCFSSQGTSRGRLYTRSPSRAFLDHVFPKPEGGLLRRAPAPQVRRYELYLGTQVRQRTTAIRHIKSLRVKKAIPRTIPTRSDLADRFITLYELISLQPAPDAIIGTRSVWCSRHPTSRDSRQQASADRIQGRCSVRETSLGRPPSFVDPRWRP